MTKTTNDSISRRRFMQTTALATAGMPFINCGKVDVVKPMTREFGRLGFDVTTLGLGGQASIQWTPEDVDPVKIILKAFDSGVNYFDTSNAYGPSQLNYGKAFQTLHLIPGKAGYDEPKRRSVFLTTKTGLRWSKGGREVEGVRSFTHGPKGSHTADDIKRTLSQVFGDDNGQYPTGAYIDMILIHSLKNMAEIDVLYEGYDNPDPKAENIGALAALMDYRDGTNMTGLNPQEEKLIRHIGFSGHFSPAAMMEMIRRDRKNILDGMLVAINANDRLNFNMQYNVIPVAAAKNMGVIAMKTFADGAMYTKEATWSREPKHVVRTVGSQAVPSRSLVEYTLTTPGVHTAIIGIGQIDDNQPSCQLAQNMSSAQVKSAGLSESDRRDIEKIAHTVKNGETNYFQLPREELSPPIDPSMEQKEQNGHRVVTLAWHSAYAGDEPVVSYEIWSDNRKMDQIEHQPQTSKMPFTYKDMSESAGTKPYKIVAVDAAGRTAATEDLLL
ncbi:aldo/keto reductase [Candidatus Latescibacterota bacterium]